MEIHSHQSAKKIAQGTNLEIIRQLDAYMLAQADILLTIQLGIVYHSVPKGYLQKQLIGLAPSFVHLDIMLIIKLVTVDLYAIKL